MKVGVVGTGLAGLSVAWLLAQEGHEITVFEKNRTIGFDSHSLDIKVGGKDYRVDVPLRMFDETYYKNLSAFYSKVGINYERGDYCQSYGYHSGEGADSENTGIYFRYYNHLIGTYSLPFVKGINVFSVTFLKIAFDALRLYCLAPFHLRDKKVEKMTFGEYLRSHNYSTVFIDNVLLPAVSAMCTCSYEDAQNYPAFILLTYFTRRAFNGIRRVTGGSKEVIEKISKQFSAIHCNTPVNSVYPSTEKGKVVVVDTNNVEYTFDHVVLATQANHASSILKKSSNMLIDTLKTFEYVKGAVFVHTDTNIMPKVVNDWGNVHFGFIKNSNYPVASIWLNSVMKSLHGDAIDVFQTVYPSQNMVEPSKLLGVMNFERPIMNETTVQALQALREYQGKDNIWFCGAHAIYGVPLLENAVKSGVYVAQQLGCKVPWNVSQLEFGPQMPSLPPMLKYIGAIVFVVLLSILFGLLYI